MLHRTPLHEEHRNLGASLVDFAGWEMPLQYSSIIREHRMTRSSSALFDVSHMGEVLVTGPDARILLERIIPTSLSKIEPGRAMYTILCNPSGGVIDDLFVYMLSPDRFLLVINAATKEKDLEWIRSMNRYNSDVIDQTQETAKIDIQGPESGNILVRILENHLVSELPRFSFMLTPFGSDEIMVSHSGYTGEYGFEIYLPAESAVRLWRDILAVGGERILPAGLGARDTLRLEAGLSLYGHELNEERSPIESGLSWLITSENDYIGKVAIMEKKKKGVPVTIAAFCCRGKGVPREGDPVEIKGRRVGLVTSGGYSPTFEQGIGLALLEKEVPLGETMEIINRTRRLEAERCKRPLYPYKGRELGHN